MSYGKRALDRLEVECKKHYCERVERYLMEHLRSVAVEDGLQVVTSAGGMALMDAETDTHVFPASGYVNVHAIEDWLYDRHRKRHLRPKPRSNPHVMYLGHYHLLDATSGCLLDATRIPSWHDDYYSDPLNAWIEREADYMHFAPPERLTYWNRTG